MSNNKPKSSVTPVNQHLQNKGKPTNPNDVVAAARAAQEAKAAAAKAEDTKKPVEAEAEEAAKPEPKQAVDVKAEDATKEPEADKADSKDSNSDDKKPRKRLNRSQWVAILDKKEREGLTAAQIAEEHGVTEGNVYQWASKLKAEAEEAEAEAEAAKLSPSNLVNDAIELMKGITGELEAFDAKIEAAKALVDNATKERKVIEDSRKKYEQIVELLGTDEDKAKAKEVADSVKAK